MRRIGLIFALLLATSLAFAPVLADAAAGSGSSMGSRGSNTYRAPPPTATAPGTAVPMQRSTTAPPAARPSQAAPAPGVAQPAAGGFFGRSPFVSGLLGGMIGAGIGGMLFGGGFFHGIGSFGGFFGFLIQILLVVLIGRWLFTRFFRPATAGGPEIVTRMPTENVGMGGSLPAQSGPPPVAIGPADYKEFEQNLQAVQAAWSNQEINALRAVVTPEMLSYFSEQLSELASRGARNMVTSVHLEQGDLSEAWAEPGREYATVAMRFSMIDVTVDNAGHVLDGNAQQRTQTTEVWTFLRAPGAHWLLSAIQQTR